MKSQILFNLYSSHVVEHISFSFDKVKSSLLLKVNNIFHLAGL